MWAPDGRTLYYAISTGQPIVAARLETEPVPVVLSIDTALVMPALTLEPHPGSALHPDGDRFLMVVGGDARTLGAEEGPSECVILIQNYFEELGERFGEH